MTCSRATSRSTPPMAPARSATAWDLKRSWMPRPLSKIRTSPSRRACSAVSSASQTTTRRSSAPCASISKSIRPRRGRTCPLACEKFSSTAWATRRCASITRRRTAGTRIGSPSTPVCAISCTSAMSRRPTRTPRQSSNVTSARSPARRVTAPVCAPRCSPLRLAASPFTRFAA